MRSLRSFMLVIWCAVAVGQAEFSVACPVCVSVGDPFQLPHPHALRISVATRKAIDRGELRDVRTRESAALDAVMFRVANHQFGNGIARPGGASIVDVLLVDEPALYRIELRGITSRVVALQGERHRAADVRLVTTRAALESLARGEITIREGIRLGLIEIEGVFSALKSRDRNY